ncbi:DUF305 domain-containing protein [Thermomicrobiaceae bacterium CFH 74404]|uniref:DUF305 domain-containing protein n=1 Tax=Thermalbibacter longus TaxID=2951981 RepID=A0AA41WD25_9BACT|nr:DUF305 domain-containing protein [Thermalbibacter longus]MCM8748269.1 DUF305 domain-containing protein [Thermalbibacter longus]
MKRAWLMPALGALAVLLVACGEAGTSPTPAGAPSPGEPTPASAALSDEQFLAAMIEHHQGAIDMAEIALDRAEHPEVRQLSEEIIAAQQAEIEQMRAWQREWFGAEATPGGHAGHGMSDEEMGMDVDLEELRRAEPFDRAFLEAMIRHHEGAVRMAEQIRSSTKRPELRELADDIIATQQREIEQMRAWLADWYGQ